jgi:hypothetical protein
LQEVRLVGTKTLSLGLILLTVIAVGFVSIVLETEHNPEAAITDSYQVSSKIELAGVEICFECHDPAQTIGFHYPDTIMGIEEFKGLRRRICVDCHGPEGTDQNRAMTAESKITWIDEKGYFRIKSDVPHGIHFEKMENGAMMCETCHLIKDGDPTKLGDELVIPIPNPGQIIVCEMCHVPSNPGNYISLHITYGHQECNTCHTGDLTNIHKRATGALGRTS